MKLLTNFIVIFTLLTLGLGFLFGALSVAGWLLSYIAVIFPWITVYIPFITVVGVVSLIIACISS